MKDQNFSIKISDLLKQTGSVDEIVFDGKFSSQLEGLTDEGISGVFHLQSLSDSALLGELTDLHCVVKNDCDSCQKSFKRTIDIPEYVSNFVIKKKNKKEDDDAEEEFEINAKTENIDIEDMILQAILLNDPIVIRCDSCNKKIEEDTMSDEEFLDSLPGSSCGNIRFS